jgi:TrmH family RNA methyltransferase
VEGNPLDRIVIVLWETQDLVNIAATVRAMKNFGLCRLRLVSPVEWDAWRIEGIAHDTQEIVEKTVLFDSLPDALADCSHVVAMTARGRRAKRAMVRPREFAPDLLARATPRPDGAAEAPVAVLFGREDQGLPNWALDLAHRTATIPTNPEHPSLNLAQAVLVVAYELWLADEGGNQPFKPPRRDAPPANVQLLDKTFADVEAALWTVDFFKSRQPESVMRSLREIAHRAELDTREAGLIRAVSIEVRKFFDRIRGGGDPDANSR